jgi:hypothetical protein
MGKSTGVSTFPYRYGIPGPVPRYPSLIPKAVACPRRVVHFSLDTYGNKLFTGDGAAIDLRYDNRL